MKLEQSFEVAAPLDRVWAALIDVEKVAPCLPGAEITGRNDDGTYNGSFRVKIGPTAAAYVGKLEMENVDEASHSATMQAAGTDRRGQGGAKATIASSVKEGAAGTSVVEVSTEYSITGRLARFGRGGMIEEIGNRLLTEFAAALQAMLAGPGEYETFVGMPAVGAADAATGGAADGAADAGGAGGKPKRKPRKDLAAAAEAVAAASQPAAPEPEPVGAAEPEPGVEDLPDLAVEAAAEEELSAIVPEASVESEPPRAEVPQPPSEPELVPPAPEPVPSEPAPEPEVVPPAPEVVPPEPEVVPPEPEPAPEPEPRAASHPRAAAARRAAGAARAAARPRSRRPPSRGRPRSPRRHRRHQPPTPSRSTAWPWSAPSSSNASRATPFRWSRCWWGCCSCSVGAAGAPRARRGARACA